MTISIALVYPDLLGTYGDGGNAIVLAQRLRWRGIEAEVVTVPSGKEVPESCELYVIGGGEDLPQGLAAAKLRASRALHKAVGSGAVVLAVCAGLQILGESFSSPDGKDRKDGKGSEDGDYGEDGNNGRDGQGLGLLPCVTRRGTGRRAVGEVLVRPTERWASLGLLTGFENHGAVTELLPGAEATGEVLAGVGNKDGTCEGVVSGRIWGTYLHGPVLARNPKLADLLLSWAVGDLAPLEDTEPDALHAERCHRGPQERPRPGPGARWRTLRRRP